MGEQGDHFRRRARDCLNLAKGARTKADRAMLEDITAELEAEAKKIDAEEEAGRPTRR